MNVRGTLAIFLAVACLWTGWQRFAGRPVHPVNGQIAPSEPVQTLIEEGATIRHGRWTLTPRAAYDVTARILSREDYRFDRIADLVPEDLALGWGPMSDSAVLANLDISQGVRFYTWRPRGPLPVTREVVTTHSANTHVIPADGSVRSQLAHLRIGQVVHLTGSLVDAKRDDGTWVQTSLTREDSGPGACEVLLVERVEVR